MRALVFDGKVAALHDRSEPERAEGYALVKVNLAGVCNTDLEIARGYMGFVGVLGHEFVGSVVEGPDELQRRLLEDEGIDFDLRGRVDLTRYQWRSGRV